MCFLNNWHATKRRSAPSGNVLVTRWCDSQRRGYRDSCDLQSAYEARVARCAKRLRAFSEARRQERRARALRMGQILPESEAQAKSRTSMQESLMRQADSLQSHAKKMIARQRVLLERSGQQLRHLTDTLKSSQRAHPDAREAATRAMKIAAASARRRKPRKIDEQAHRA